MTEQPSEFEEFMESNIPSSDLLEQFTDKQLVEEIKRRERAKAKPVLIKEVGDHWLHKEIMAPVIDLCLKYVDDIVRGKQKQPKEYMCEVFNEALQCCFGVEVFPWISKFSGVDLISLKNIVSSITGLVELQNNTKKNDKKEKVD